MNRPHAHTNAPTSGRAPACAEEKPTGARLRGVWAALELAAAAAVALAVFALAAVGLAGTVLPERWPLTLAVLAVGAAAAALLARRWLASTSGLMPLLAFSTMPGVLAAGPDEAALAALVAVGLAAFAWANVPGREAMDGSRRPRMLFAAAAGGCVCLAGFEGVLLLLGPCLLAACLSSDARSARFVFSPGALLAIVLCGAARATALWGDPLAAALPGWTAAIGHAAAGTENLLAIAAGLLPWWPLAAAATLAGIRVGHYATPFWRLCGCWLLVALLGAAIGLVPAATAAAAMLVPMAIVSGHALCVVRAKGAAAWRRRDATRRERLDVAMFRVRLRPTVTATRNEAIGQRLSPESRP